MAPGIRKAALCCVGKLSALWCICVDDDDDDEGKGNRLALVKLFINIVVCIFTLYIQVHDTTFVPLN